MIDFKLARFNMVEQQIRPWDVLDFKLLEVLSEIPRENFVENQYKNFAYADMNIPLANGSVMIEPKIIARLIQALNLDKSKNVLEIATGSGYATAILAKMSHSVTTFEIDNQQLNIAQKNLENINVKNVNFINKDGLDAKNQNLDNYNAIYIGGALHTIPQWIESSLANNSSIVAVVGHSPVMEALLLKKIDDKITKKNLFFTCIPYLTETEFDRSKTFKF